MLKQAYRDVAVISPLGEDAFVFRRMTAAESVSDLFRFDVEILTTRPTVDFEAVLGQTMTVRVSMDGGARSPGRATRYFNGFVTRFSHLGSQGRYGHYRAELRPWLWFLTRNRDSRIFQDLSVPDIVTTVLREHGLTEIQTRLSGDYLPWEYCVQYQESDFAFISRLLEHEGIYYYFVHHNGSHTLVLSDGIGSHDHLALSPSLRFSPERRQGEIGRIVTDWTISRSVTAGIYTVDDYDFERPKAQLQASLSLPRAHPFATMEVFEYPGNMAYMKSGERSAMGNTYARNRLEAIQSRHETIEGSTIVRDLAYGQLFTLTHHPAREQNREYLVVSTLHDIASDAFEAGAGDAGGETTYECRFAVLPSREPYRPQPLTPVPVMRGPQTAIVSGKAGEEIWTDKFGRIKVHFHWDRTGKADETSSCWVRVAQSWAGKRWGAQFLPRVGQEVIVDFLDGDPNRPIVTGAVYNGDATPPFALPENATQSGVRSNSSKNATGFNEMRFEDKAGRERLYFHAQRAMDTRVRAVKRESVGGDRHGTVDGAQYAMVEGNRHDIVWTDGYRNVDTKLTEMVGTEHHEEVGENYMLKAGLEIAVEAGVTISLKASGGFITIGPAGVTISGKIVQINSGGAASGLSAAPVIPDEAQYATSGDPGQGGGVRRGRRTPRLVANRGRIAQIAAQRVAAEWGAAEKKLKAEQAALAEQAKKAAESIKAVPGSPDAGGEPLTGLEKARSVFNDLSSVFNIPGKYKDAIDHAFNVAINLPSFYDALTSPDLTKDQKLALIEQAQTMVKDIKGLLPESWQDKIDKRVNFDALVDIGGKAAAGYVEDGIKGAAGSGMGGAGNFAVQTVILNPASAVTETLAAPVGYVTSFAAAVIGLNDSDRPLVERLSIAHDLAMEGAEMTKDEVANINEGLSTFLSETTDDIGNIISHGLVGDGEAVQARMDNIAQRIHADDIADGLNQAAETVGTYAQSIKDTLMP